jgi:hypothetical protein
LNNLFTIILLVAFDATSIFARQNTLIMDFEQIIVDFGRIQLNSETVRTFSLKNTGSALLIIKGASGSSDM